MTTHFPCQGCGSALVFQPGTGALTCPHCGSNNPIAATTHHVREVDLDAALAKDTALATVEREVTECTACGAQVTLAPHVTAERCSFCDTPLGTGHHATRQILPRALLPFAVEQKAATGAFRSWIGSRWFAPNDLKMRAREEAIHGVYIPFWTFDAETESYYRGERGEYYYVTETYTTQEDGRTVTKSRQVRHTRWHAASGVVWRHFDDVLVCGSTGLPDALVQRLEPWDLDQLVDYDNRYLAGFRAECYRVDLRGAFERAKAMMAPVIRAACAADIGGDEQRVHQVRTQHHNVTFKHILLPLWISAYRYRGKAYRFVVNARTGEVQGERPYSWVKITAAVMAALALLGGAVMLLEHLG